MSSRKYLAVALATVTAASCGGGGAATAPIDGGGGPPAAGWATLSMSPASGSVEVGGTFQLTATAMDAQGQPVLNAPAPTYESLDAAKATVTAGGLVTGVAPGAVTIRAILSSNGVTDTATADLTVVPKATPGTPAPAFTTLVIAPEVGTVQAGGTLQLTATPRDQSGAAMAGLPAPTFATSDATKATVSGTGVVTGVAAGAVTITASLTTGGVTRQAQASLTVTAPAQPSAPTSAAVQGIDDAFAPSAVTISTGGTVTWTMVDEEHDVTWTGAAPAGGNIPRIDKGSSVQRTFSTAGAYTYRCDRHDGEHGGTVTVVAGGGGGGPAPSPVFTSLSVTPGSPAVQVGSTVALTATPRDQNGAAMSGLPAAAWSTGNAGVATVSATGVVTGVAAGTTTITASVTSGGVTRTGQATVTVTSTPPATPPTQPMGVTVTTPGVTFSPQTVTIQAGGTVTWQISGSRHNVTFSGAAPTGGNIPDTDGQSVSRTFPNAGTYDYVCTRHNGMSGRVVVQ